MPNNAMIRARPSSAVINPKIMLSCFACVSRSSAWFCTFTLGNRFPIASAAARAAASDVPGFVFTRTTASSCDTKLRSYVANETRKSDCTTFALTIPTM